MASDDLDHAAAGEPTPVASTAPMPVKPDGLWLDDLAEGMTFRSDAYEVTHALKWPSATRPGDLLHLEVTVGAITPSGSRPDRGSVILSYDTINQHGEIRQQTSGRVIAWRRPQPRP